VRRDEYWRALLKAFGRGVVDGQRMAPVDRKRNLRTFFVVTILLSIPGWCMGLVALFAHWWSSKP
jgi:hypothetical protein